jgi:DNA phosphorothioation-dependent restriction protein DptG
MNKTIRQRKKKSSTNMSNIQQSLMTTKRETRVEVMRLTKKIHEKSKIFNYIMSILKESKNIKKKTKSYRFKKFNEFSTKKRSQQKKLSDENSTMINEWFNTLNIIIDVTTKTSEQKRKTKRLFYTWRNCFFMKMTNIKITNLMKHFIVLKSNSKSIKKRIFKYTSKERKFANQIFSQMKEASMIIRMNSD